jgi:ZIP family zinc transporter
MIYVVVDDLIPEVTASGNTVWSTWGCMIGFLVMMILDVALG